MNALSRPRFPAVLLVGLAVCGIALALLPAAGIMHAVAKHGEDARTALNCRPEDMISFYNPDTGRTGFVCQKEDGKWYIVIVAAIGVVTAFCKNKMKKREQVEKYMKNAGYDLLQ